MREINEIDYMESYTTDALAQSNYVTSASESVDQEQTNTDNFDFLGNVSGEEWRCAQSFQLSGALVVDAVEVRCSNIIGSPTGNWTIRIETDNAGNPSGTLANSNASVVVTPPSANNVVKGVFAIPFPLSASTTYWIKINCDNQSSNNYWFLTLTTPSNYANGNYQRSVNGSWTNFSTYDFYFKIYTGLSLQSYSESTIKTQGSYSLKVVAAQTGSLNKTLTRTISPPLDLSDCQKIKFDLRSNRTGSNIKFGFHDSGGTTTEITPNITTADEFETVILDISSVANADKDAIDSIIVTMVNADADNTFYLDNMFVSCIDVSTNYLVQRGRNRFNFNGVSSGSI